MSEQDDQRFSPAGQPEKPIPASGRPQTPASAPHPQAPAAQPGWTPPPGYGGPPPPRWATSGAPGSLHPPVIPFYPLTVGSLFSGTFAAIRSNPKVLFTISLGTTAVLGLLSGLVSALVVGTSEAGSWVGDQTAPYGMPAGDGVGAALWQILAENAVTLISAAVMLLVTGMLVLTVANTVVGKNVSVGQAWEELKPHLWRLIGTALLVWAIMTGTTIAAILPVVLFAFLIATTHQVAVWILLIILSIVAAIALLAWLTVRLYFSTQAVVLEDVSPTRAIARSWQLTRDAFWRIAGRALLMAITVGMALSIMTGIFAALILAATAFMPTAVSTFLITLVSMLLSGLVVPVSAAYSTLMYIDERMRKENLGPALRQALVANRGY